MCVSATEICEEYSQNYTSLLQETQQEQKKKMQLQKTKLQSSTYTQHITTCGEILVRYFMQFLGKCCSSSYSVFIVLLVKLSVILPVVLIESKFGCPINTIQDKRKLATNWDIVKFLFIYLYLQFLMNMYLHIYL